MGAHMPLTPTAAALIVAKFCNFVVWISVESQEMNK